MIQLSDFSIGFDGCMLLDNVDVRIEDRRLTALIGRNGSGKSTLLRAIAGLNRSYGGDVYLNGINARDMSPEMAASNIAYVSTGRPRVLDLSCSDVVAMGRAPYTDWIGRLKREDREIVGRSLESVGMTSYAHRTLDTLSDGECQRVMIARALAQCTPVIVLDEPTSFLDLPGRYELCSLLATLAHDDGKCVFFSTHELDIALSMCDDVALIDTPRLHCMSAMMMRDGGYIDRLFCNSRLTFDRENASVIVRK